VTTGPTAAIAVARSAACSVSSRCADFATSNNRLTVFPVPGSRVHVRVSVGAARGQRLDHPDYAYNAMRPIAGVDHRVACSLCKGWCCRSGEDNAFLDETTMARVRYARSALDVRAVLRLYVERVPEVGFEDSCIFHGKQGCTLDRSLRSDVCNSYFCSGLQVYMTGGDAVTPTMIIAGVGDQMRTSPILMP
jgi:hypothetical protein